MCRLTIDAAAIGEVEGRNILIVDDMIDTAGTICMAADMLMSRGAKSVRAAITHPVLSGPAYERINDSALEEVIVTDTIPLNPDKDLHKFTVLSVADIFADVIERVHNYKEISSIFSSSRPAHRSSDTKNLFLAVRKRFFVGFFAGCAPLRPIGAHEKAGFAPGFRLPTGSYFSGESGSRAMTM